jgi:Papain family cysteine protease
VYVHTFGQHRGGHCVLVIGYDGEFMCWICKNSWGPHWGEGGFFRIAYGQNVDHSTFRGVSGMQLGDRWPARAFLERFSGTNATDLLLYNGVNAGIADRWMLAGLLNVTSRSTSCCRNQPSARAGG